MLPSRPDADTPDSERKVFAAFERHLPRDWTVFHSRRIVLPRHGRPVRCRVRARLSRHRPCQGHSRPRGEGRHRHRPRRGGLVFRQQSSSSHQVAGCTGATSDAHAAGLPANARRSVPSFGWGVVFPDAESPEALGPELPRRLVIDGEFPSVGRQGGGRASSKPPSAPALPSHRSR